MKSRMLPDCWYVRSAPYRAPVRYRALSITSWRTTLTSRCSPTRRLASLSLESKGLERFDLVQQVFNLCLPHKCLDSMQE